MKQGKTAFITLLSSLNYLKAVLVLNRSLQEVKSNYPLIVAVVHDIYTVEIENIFRQENIIPFIIERLSYSQSTIDRFNRPDVHENGSVLNTASKFQIFSLKNWEQLIYIDADTLVLKNIDELAQWPDGSMIKHSKDESGHSGLFIVETKNHKEMEFYLTILKTCQGYDGDILAKLWFFVRSNKHYQIPGDIYLHYYDYEEPYNSNIKVIHFCNDLKPWLEPEHFHFHPNNYYAWLYLKFLNELEKKYNFDFL